MESNVQEILAEALSLTDPTERRAWLESVCADNHALLAEVESLLTAFNEAGNFFDRSSPISTSDSAFEQAGAVIGRYKLLEQIGEGGFGTVWMAEQQEPIRRKVALKIVKLGMDTRQVVARFEAERQALAMMDHPNIATIFDGGMTATGRPYFVMELVKGISMTQFCDANKLSTRGRLELFIEVCQAVQHAHQKGVIHRDLKPSNILVASTDGRACPKIIDFGVAKALGAKLTEKTLFTRLSQMIGTPAYMSPEQAELSGSDVDTRSDIYALGVLLYELLTGVPPFDRETMAKATLDEWRRLIREEDPPKPSTRLFTLGPQAHEVSRRRQTEPVSLRRQLRGELDLMVMKCLEKDRRQRYETASALAHDLERFLRHEPISAVPPTLRYRLSKTVRRHHLLVGVASLSLILLLAGIISTVVQMVRANRYAAQTQRSSADLADNLYAADMYLAQNAVKGSDIGLAFRTLSAHRPTPGFPDRRGFEWRYFWQLCQAERLRFWQAHSNTVLYLALSPDGRWLASGGYEDGGKLWDLASGRVLKTFPRDESFAFSPSGEFLFAAGNHQQVQIWNARSLQLEEAFSTGVPLAEYRPSVRLAVSPTSPILAFCPEGTFFSGAGNYRLYDYRTRRILGQLTNSGDHAVFSADGRLLITGSAQQRLHVWDVASRNEIRTLGPVDQVASLALAPDGRLLASTEFWRPDIRLWDPATGQELAPLSGHESMVWQTAFSPDGLLLASGSSDQTVRLWDVPQRRLRKRLLGHESEVWSVAFSSDGRRLYSGSKDLTISEWPTTYREPQNSFPVANTSVSPPFFSQDGQLIAYAAGTGETIERIEVRNSKTLKVVATLPQEQRALWFAPGNRQLLTLSGQGELHLHSLSPQTLLRSVSLPTSPTRNWGAVASRDGREVAAWLQSSNQLWLLDLDSGRVRRQLSSADFTEKAVAFSPVSPLLAAVADRILEVWNTQSGQLALRVEPHLDGISSVCFSPDGRLLATASVDNTAKLWSVSNLQEIATFRGHREGLMSVAFSPDNRTMATGCGDGSLKLWHLATRREMVDLKPLSKVWFVGFSPDGNSLVCAPGSGTLRFLRAPPMDQLDSTRPTR